MRGSILIPLNLWKTFPTVENPKLWKTPLQNPR